MKKEISTYGESPDKGTSLKGDAHRGWMNLKTAFSSSNDEEAILEETVRGEKAAIKEYHSILEEPNLPDTTISILEMQRDNIKTSLNEVENMKTIA